jgi:anthranilate/para-aminobenzoate synthase component I
MGFLLPVRFFGLFEESALKPPFDIAGDLDTPVSAFMKLAAFGPRFLLESVEGGERLARYSFIGFGDGLEVSAAQSRGRAPSCCPVCAMHCVVRRNRSPTSPAYPWRAVS